MLNTLTRSRYSPSGIVSLGRFFPLLAVAMLCDVLLAVVLYMLLHAGWYWVLLTPTLAGALVGFLMTIVVRESHCRSPGLAASIGFTSGVVMYVGMFYVGMIASFGVENAGRFDLFVDYVKFRAATDVQHDVHETPNAARRPQPVMNWIMFAGEFALAVYFATKFPMARAARPFCETCNAWKQQRIVLFPPKSGKTIAAWVKSGVLGMLAHAKRYYPGRKDYKFTSVAVEFCPENGQSPPCPVFFSVKDVWMGGGALPINQFDAAWGSTWVTRIELTPEEVMAIGPVFPELRGWLAH